MYPTKTQEQHHSLLASLARKIEKPLASPQDARIRLPDGTEMLNFCSNNYLGLANDPRLREVAIRALETHGIGMASVRFICGTQDIHRQLESEVAEWVGAEDCILYSSCFDANAGLFEALLSENDAIISDALNHASLIDGIRLCKAKRYRYANRDLQELERCLKEARQAGAETILVVSDGVFSMDGTYADVRGICDLAEQYEALVFIDDSHAIGFVGPTGAGTPERDGCQSRVDLISGTFGKALGGASGGYVAGRKGLIEVLRQKSRPYLFSNSLAPALVEVAREAIRIARNDAARRENLWTLARWWRRELETLGFPTPGDVHPICPIILKDDTLSQQVAEHLFRKGIYTSPFSYPVVPRGQARIRTQISAAHTQSHLEYLRDTLKEALAT